MNIVKVKDYNEMSRHAADLILTAVKAKPNAVLGLATGSTPAGAYKLLAEACKSGQADFSGITTVNLDEYYGLTPDNPQSYRYFMDENLFKAINIDKSRTHIPDGTASDPEAECERYEKLIEALGWADLQILGIGRNGHIAFNEPCGHFPARTHHVQLDESTIEANSRFFDSRDDVPKSAISMGIGTIMKARKLIMLASGADKTDAVKKALFGLITPQVPASALQLHHDVTIITDCL